METPFPPFDPDDDPTNSKTRLRDIPLRTLFPNILTLLAICSGLTAIRFAIELRIEMALGAIVLAAFLDGIDGRVARFLKSTSRFGAEMDSLADFVNFGVAPAMILYFTLLKEVSPFGWVAALLYAMCACLRLARFNVQLEAPKGPKWQNNFFVGMPAPAAAMVVLLPIYISLLGVEITFGFVFLVAIYVIFVGFLMVSNLPTYSGKNLGQNIPRNIALPLILLSVLIIAILLSYPWETLVFVVLVYLGSIPWSGNYYKKKQAAHLAMAATRKPRTKKKQENK